MRWGVFYRTFLKRVKENMFEKSNSKYLGFIEFALALLCELRTIRIVQEKRQETFVVIVRWGDTDAVGMRILAAKRLNVEK